MENRKSILKMFLIVVFGYALIAFSANISSQDEDISETNEAEVTEESEMNETDNGSSLKKIILAYIKLIQTILMVIKIIILQDLQSPI